MKTPITYYGGKQRLADVIISMMPPHKIYCEPFFGGGAVFFAKGPSDVEVINDHDERLITFYRQVVENFDGLSNKIQHTLHSEAEWKKARRIFYGKGEHKADGKELDIAWSVWVLCNMSYSGSPNCGWKWDNKNSTPDMLDVKRKAFTEALHARLAHCQISCRDAITVIEQRDSADTFFYLDPPYVGCQQQHYHGYSEEDFEILLTTLQMIKGKFILSHFGNEQLNKVIEQCGWHVRSFTSDMTVANNCRVKNRKKQELLVSNYQPFPSLFDKQE